MIYRLEKQREIVKECSGANHRDISKIIAKWWKEMTDEEKSPYRREAWIAKERHRILYPNYKLLTRKKTKKKRAYLKRPKNEFSAVAYEKRKQLFEIYRRGKPVKDTEREMVMTQTSQGSDCLSSAVETQEIHCSCRPNYHTPNFNDGQEMKMMQTIKDSNCTDFETQEIPQMLSPSYYIPTITSFNEQLFHSTGPFLTLLSLDGYCNLGPFAVQYDSPSYCSIPDCDALLQHNSLSTNILDDCQPIFNTIPF
ncbi:hypothetical protein G6F56_010173 [Rhizopus delemar]|nr:hypothetical protein G6F56_010173 [Rhizopus delemar]